MQIFTQQLPWYIAGPAAALLVVVLQWAANLPLGATGAIASLPTWLRGRGEKDNAWRLWFLGGMVLGGFLFTQMNGTFHPNFANDGFDAVFGNSSVAWRSLILLCAGLLLGFGARTSGGCTSGHGLCGISRGSKGGLTATVLFVLVAVATANIIQWWMAR